MNISVIVPVYNVEKYIERSLRSLFEQTKTNEVEFIIINDKTPDCSIDIAKRIAKEYSSVDVKFFEMEQNGGSALARQEGTDNASGELRRNFDSDVWCES